MSKFNDDINDFNFAMQQIQRITPEMTNEELTRAIKKIYKDENTLKAVEERRAEMTNDELIETVKLIDKTLSDVDLLWGKLFRIQHDIRLNDIETTTKKDLNRLLASKKNDLLAQIGENTLKALEGNGL